MSTASFVLTSGWFFQSAPLATEGFLFLLLLCDSSCLFKSRCKLAQAAENIVDKAQASKESKHQSTKEQQSAWRMQIQHVVGVVLVPVLVSLAFSTLLERLLRLEPCATFALYWLADGHSNPCSKRTCYLLVTFCNLDKPFGEPVNIRRDRFCFC